MADMKMVDNEDHREDRKIQAKTEAGYDYNRFPNRKERRNIAKKRGVFGHEGLWPHVNGGKSNRQTVERDDA